MQYGRIELFTDVPKITSENIADVMREIMPKHEQNSRFIDYLINFEAGCQPLLREKKYRSDINVECVDNVANEVTDFKLGYGWGNPITLVMREKPEMSTQDMAQAVSLLNRCFYSQDYNAKQQKFARFVEICGLGYTYIDINTDYEDGDSPFTYNVLDPRCTFVVKSSYYIDQRVMLSGTYRCTSDGAKHFTCFTNDTRYELNHLYEHLERSDEINPLGINPITEWIRSYDRMGCFERQIPEMNNLNLLVSDFSNDVDQNTQAIWHCNDVDFPIEIIELEDGTEEERVRKPKTNDWLQTFTAKGDGGKTPFVTPLAINYDYPGMLNNIITRRALILQKCNVPSRNDNSGGSTGIAMSDATGWTQAEVEATKQDQIKESCKINEVKIALRAIAKSRLPQDSPLRKLHYTDVKASIKRQKTYEMTTKINAYATGISHGINYEDMINAINLFDDPQQVAKNSKETTQAYLDSVFKSNQNEPVGGIDEKAPNADRLEQDKSDQIANSPNIDGMSTN